MILPANLRDVTYVLGNLRGDDRRELEAQYRDPDLVKVGFMLAKQMRSFIAYNDAEVPVMAFGVAHLSATTVSLWSMSTPGVRKSIAKTTRFVMGPLRDDLRRQNYQWAEARSDERNDMAHKWLRRLDCKLLCPLEKYGKDGEDFLLFRGAI